MKGAPASPTGDAGRVIAHMIPYEGAFMRVTRSFTHSGYDVVEGLQKSLGEGPEHLVAKSYRPQSSHHSLLETVVTFHARVVEL